MTFFKSGVVFLFLCLCCEMVLSDGEVTLVHRNATDSFRIGEDGCTNDSSICTNHSATCHPSGLCLCSSGSPDFRNPTVTADSSVKYGESYGCVRKDLTRLSVDAVICPFAPFQVIPYSHNSPATQFHHDSLNQNDTVVSCSLDNILAKFPNNFTEMKQQWLNESYVDLTILNNTMHFKWRRSVPELQGTIITFILRCTLSLQTFSNKCLRAKILGTWAADVVPVEKTEPTLISTEHTSSQKTTPSSQSATDLTTPKLNTTFSAKTDDCESDSNATGQAIYAIFAISLVVNLALGLIVAFLWRKLIRIQDKNIDIREMQSIDKQRRRETADVVSPYDYVVDDGGIQNLAADHHKPSPVRGNSDMKDGQSESGYEVPSNYEPLRRNDLKDDEDNYQSLTKP